MYLLLYHGHVVSKEFIIISISYVNSREHIVASFHQDRSNTEDNNIHTKNNSGESTRTGMFPGSHNKKNISQAVLRNEL